MFFLINDSDNSINFVTDSEEKILPGQCHEGLTQVEIPDETLPSLERDVLIDLFYVPPSEGESYGRIADKGFRKVPHEEIVALLEREEEFLLAYQNQEGENFNKLVSALQELFPNNEQIAQLVSDEMITADELSEIESIFNSNLAGTP